MRDLVGDAPPGRQAHQPQVLLHLLVVHDFQKWRLLKLYGDPWRNVPSNTGRPVWFTKSARTIVSLSVSLACAMKIEVACDQARQQSRGSNNSLPTLCECRPPRAPLQALQVRANFRSTLIAQLTVALQAFRYDAPQLPRQLGAWPDRIHGTLAGSHFIQHQPE